jgi:hypothetical protein
MAKSPISSAPKNAKAAKVAKAAKGAGGMKLPVARVKTEIPSPGKNKMNKVVKVFGPSAPFTFEVYMYEASGEKDGFTNHIRNYVNENPNLRNVINETFDEANFVKFAVRRVPFSANEPLTDIKGYNRYVFIRFLGDRANPGIPVYSTVESRQIGLLAFCVMLRDGRLSTYPEDMSLRTEDITNETLPQPLDMFLKDETIKECMEFDLDPEMLVPGFVEMYEDFAPICWRGPNYSIWAQELGFGSE